MKIKINCVVDYIPYGHAGEIFEVLAADCGVYRYRDPETKVIYGVEKKYCQEIKEQLMCGNLDAYENFQDLMDKKFPDQKTFDFEEARYIFNKGINTGIYRCHKEGGNESDRLQESNGDNRMADTNSANDCCNKGDVSVH